MSTDSPFAKRKWTLTKNNILTPSKETPTPEAEIHCCCVRKRPWEWYAAEIRDSSKKRLVFG
jgi:hypothetical protein